MCYCEKPEQELFKDLKQASVPDDALLRACCWRRLCQIRGNWLHEVSDGAWGGLCDRRAQLAKQQPRKPY
ncbi:MAG: hypothetical protein ACREI3_08735 [Nitrospirales bacterium]